MSIAPEDWISGWNFNDGTVSFPIASLEGLTAENADAQTGDIREVLFRLLEHVRDKNESLPAAERPTKMTFTRGTSGSEAGGVTTVTRSHTLRFLTDVGALAVQPEPEPEA